jgi:hypothetical protein
MPERQGGYEPQRVFVQVRKDHRSVRILQQFVASSRIRKYINVLIVELSRTQTAFDANGPNFTLQRSIVRGEMTSPPETDIAMQHARWLW